ncbi:hypothetical protein AJ80_05657 [Polytolypa hystricis UAMH7299]|uniref:Zn(2)-C6 fungal-type domain-containing protein n=1 Tax=Polytolypa hystricis (strain UAMH7299) TaxID=1447883 RepID=A0A2B7Y1R9_POLH7|nr:hypothetical protein AJ80_05657 [Polytolypa hystricis UAMH7299]
MRMEAVATEGKKQLAAISAPPGSQPLINRLPPPTWRPYNSYDGTNPPDQQHLQVVPPGPPPSSQPPLQPQPQQPPPGGPSYSAPPRDQHASPHPHEMSYSRPGSISGPPPRPASEPHPSHPNYRPMNGVPASIPPGTPNHGQLPPGDYRPRPAYSGEGHPNGEHPAPVATPAPPTLTMQPPHEGMHYPPYLGTPHPHPQHSYDQYMYSQAGSTGSRPRRTTRATQACDQCRSRKAKCDEGRPACSHCKENNIPCVYKDVPPHKHERATQMIMDRIQQLEDSEVKNYQEGSEKLQTIEQGLQQLRTITEDIAKAQATIEKVLNHKQAQMTTPRVPKAETDWKVTSPEAYPPPERFRNMDMARPQRLENNELLSIDAIKKEESDSGDRGLTIPIEHTTAAHKLLHWPTIQRLLPERIDEDYVMELEESRGPIRPYGRGEGEHDGEDQSPSSSAWGTGFGSWTAADMPPRKTLNVEADTIRMYQQSYLQNIHILHPFLGEKGLDRLIEKFIRNYSQQQQQTFPPSAAPINCVPTAGSSRALKRKRSSDAAFGTEGDPSPTPVIERSVDNATVLLVLALGEICSLRTDIPGPVQGPRTRPAHSPYTALARMSTSPSDSVSTFQSPTETTFTSMTSRRPSGGPNWAANDATDPTLRNMDVIPGMTYFALASDILGNLQGGNDLPIAQASLLAALYTGQLAHPFASHGWISQASRACQVLVRRRRYDRLQDETRKDLINFAFWTCLQLESDILAELDLPASGISRLEGRMLFPKGVFTHKIPNEIRAPTTMMMLYYSAQIHLRKILNRVHTDLYKAEKQDNSGRGTWSTKIQEALSCNLELWREGLPPIMQWDDRDPPSKDINVARLRAKYYGARYIIHRPLLHHALHPMSKVTLTGAAGSPISIVSSSPNSVQHGHQGETMERWSSDMGPPTRAVSTPDQQAWKELDPRVLEACTACIEAAIHSTIAFDGIEGRPIVTNVFGTAHAQFGNMLVLSAAYMSPLSRYMDRDQLRVLFDRTITFLLQSKNISPTLRRDAEILTLVEQKIFESPQLSTSF